MLNKAGKDYLATVDDDTLADWWAEMNGGLGTLLSCEPSDVWSVMGWIFTKVGHKECLRAWNVRYRMVMSNEQFDRWYKNLGFGVASL